ncbi:MAG: cytidylate kinase-like family protein [Clostridiales bacterium]|nr:cytidylate kinase-like family protein [Clostridiales bacterium]
MSKQFIIAISREYGSGGHQIGEYIAHELGIKMYDRSIIKEIAKEMHMDPKELMEFDERPKNVITTRRVKGHSNSMEDILNEKQDEWIRRKADSGESFVIVGRRGEEILRGRPGLINIFVTGDIGYKVRRIMADRHISKEEAESELIRIDRIRRAYHNRFSEWKWGDSRHYDIIVNSAKLGADATARMMLDYVRARIARLESKD